MNAEAFAQQVNGTFGFERQGGLQALALGNGDTMSPVMADDFN